MKVMHINAVYGQGSTGIIVKDLHNISLNSDISSYVSYSISNMNENDIVNGYKVGSNFGKKTHAILCRIGGKQAYFSRCATHKLIKHLKSVKPDIVHLHNLHSNYIHLNMLLDYLGENNIKTIITLHDCWFYTGGCFHYTIDNCFKWLENCGNCPKRTQDTPAIFKDNSAIILSDRKKRFNNIKDLIVVGVSQWILNEAQRTFLNGREGHVIYNGVDTDYFVHTPSDFRKKYGIEDKFVILAVANKWLKPVNKKTFEYVTANLTEDTVMVMVGCTASQKQALPDNVIAIDYIISRDELRKVYSACDVFANCTREESMSLINVETQSCGTPIVTYRNTGAQETVDNKCSFSVANGNEKEFLDAILKVKKIGKKNLSEECRKWVKENFDRDKNYEKYISLYK